MHSKDESCLTPTQKMAATTGYIDKLAYSTEQNPGDDIMGRLTSRYVTNGQLTHDDFVAMVRFLLIAGHETSANQIALSILTLLLHPNLRAELGREPSLIHSFIEESLRFWSISQDNLTHVAAQDLEIGGVRIAQGETVVAIPAANHDEPLSRRAAGPTGDGIGHTRPVCPLPQPERPAPTSAGEWVLTRTAAAARSRRLPRQVASIA